MPPELQPATGRPPAIQQPTSLPGRPPLPVRFPSTASGPTRTLAQRPLAARLRTGIAVLLAVGVTAAVLAMYAGQRDDTAEQSTLRGFQIRVLSISQAAAENRLDGAMTALQGLEQDLDSAARDGRISAPRLRGIEAALDTVRTDITGQLESRAAASGTAAATGTAPTADIPAAPQTGAAAPEPQVVQPAADSPAPVPAVEQQPELPAAATEPQGKAKGRNKP